MGEVVRPIAGFTLDEPPIRTGTGDAVFIGRDGTRTGLVTVTNGHARTPTAPALDLEGFLPLAFVGTVDDPAIGDALIEVVPQDAHIATTPLDNAASAALARAVARAHAQGIVLDGVRPELVYLRDGHFAGLAPRGPLFVATARPFSTGLRSYATPYVGYEQIALGKPPTQATDVFALACTILALALGRHPFGDHPQMIAMAIMSNRPLLPGSSLVKLLAPALDPDPARRPTAAALADALS